MTQPVPEERNDAEDLEPGDVPPGEHAGDLPDEGDGTAPADQRENAETAQDQPSQ